MRRTIRTALAALAIVGATASGWACDIFYPEDYVEPTADQLVAGSDFAFVGRVVGYRFDDGSILEHDITCNVANDDDFEACWQERYRIVNAILSIDEPLRGIGNQARFEDTTSAEGGADCGNQYEEGAWYLVTDFMGGKIVVARYLATRLDAAPTAEQLATWRALLATKSPG